MSQADGGGDRRTLERLALAEWPEPAGARVIAVTVAGNRAQVVLSVNGDYEHWTYFQRDERGWQETVSGNAPTVDWNEPGTIRWGDDGS